jgi:hypothetical protein
VTSNGQPESITNPRTGTVMPAATGQVVKLNAAATADLRPDAAKTATAPAVASLDPRTFVAGEAYVPGAGIPARVPLAGQVAVPSDGKGVLPAACAHPIAAPGLTATTGLTVDGALADWPVGAVVGIDRAGDAATSDLDLREAYFAQDATNIYLAARVEGSWGTGDLTLDFSGLVVAAAASQTPYSNSSLALVIRGSQLYRGFAPVAQGTGVGQVDYTLAVAGGGIELRLPRSYVEGQVGTVYGLRMRTASDEIGAHIVGMTDDYACLVQGKMTVLRRGPGVTAGAAEVAYRAFIAGMQAVDAVLQDKLATVDTVAFAAESMAFDATFAPDEGVIVKVDAIDALGDAGSARQLFALGAYAYAGVYATYDYRLPSVWLRDGFARWAGIEAMGSYFGPAAAQYERHADAMLVAQENAANPTLLPRLITDALYGTAPFSTAYYRAKAGSYVALLMRLAPYDEIESGVLQQARHGWPLVDQDEFFHLLQDRRTYRGIPGEDLGQGWLSGVEDGAVLPPQLLLDSDGDGLLDYQETDAAAKADEVDTDSDGLSDAAETWLGSSPTAVQGLTTLVMDNYLADWELLAPTALKTTPSVAATTACGAESLIGRYGAVVSEGWLLVPVELKGIPTAATSLQVTLTIQTGAATAQTVFARWGDPYVIVVNGAASAVRAPAPFSGKTLELAVNAATLGWTDGTMPAGTTVALTTSAGIATCSTLAAFAPGAL